MIIVLLTPVLFAFAGLVLDGGRAIAARQRAVDIAEQAARSGVDALDETVLRSTGVDSVDPTQARAAACRYVSMEDPDAGCAVRVQGATVRVSVTTTTPTVLLGLIGFNRFTATGTATAAPVRGVAVEEGT